MNAMNKQPDFEFFSADGARGLTCFKCERKTAGPDWYTAIFWNRSDGTHRTVATSARIETLFHIAGNLLGKNGKDNAKA